MLAPERATQEAMNVARGALKDSPFPTEEQVDAAARVAAPVASALCPGFVLDVEVLKSQLMHVYSVSVDAARVLDGEKGEHVPWLPDRRSSLQWKFWKRYEDYLIRDVGMPAQIVSRVGDWTDMILERLEDPTRPGPWDRRGMVVGSVQSGKTGNYIGLINKALDAGYKLVVVLAGIHENLRAQTQLRIDEGVLGFDSQKGRRLIGNTSRIGVGLRSRELLIVNSLTTSLEGEDLSKKVTNQIGIMPGSDPIVLVMKKNSSNLKNLLVWLHHVHGPVLSFKKGVPDGYIAGLVKDTPLLLIDDEADNASINTKKRDTQGDPDGVTAINGLIRLLLGACSRSAYVGYTATPFANILINDEVRTSVHGADLFPRSFIIHVPPPSNYIGPDKVFGLDEDPDSGISLMEPLPVVRLVEDHESPAYFPQGHRLDHQPSGLPETAIRALRSFVLACAARCARGQRTKHCSMLFHVTRFQAVQSQVVTLVKEEVDSMRQRLEYGEGARTRTLVEELRELWHEDFEVNAAEISARVSPEEAQLMMPLEWSDIEPELYHAASKMEILTINGSAKEALEYKEYEATGRYVIAVGGNKLSRGLTLEGLMVSYFLRTSKMYDTLMQMGRWFGYRPGYLDLCRLYTTAQLRDWYRHIAMADIELRKEFDYMVEMRRTPEDYGLRVRTHPGGMIVTALNKMSHGTKQRCSWEGVLVQTGRLYYDADRTSRNFDRSQAFIRGLGGGSREKDLSPVVWNDVDASSVASFVESLEFPPESARASGPQLAQYIRKQVAKSPSELTNWTVVLLSSQSAAQQRRIAGIEAGLIQRSPEKLSKDPVRFNHDPGARTYALNKANIQSPGDEGLDFVGQPFTQEWYESICDKPGLGPVDLAYLQEQANRGADADKVALGLTLIWQQTDPPKLRPAKDGTTITRANGRVLRLLRRKSHGLLLVYPLLPPEQVGADTSGPPIIGLALSFPTSDTAESVEYVVNRVWGNDDPFRDADFESDDE